MSDASNGLPPGWAWATVGEVASIDGGLTKNKAKRSAATEQVPLVTVAAVGLRQVDPQQMGTIGLLESDGEKATLAEGDILVVEGNGSLAHIGRVAMWEGQVTGARHQNHLIRVRCPRGADPGYLLEWLASPAARRLVVEQATSAAGLYNLSLSKVARIGVPVAPAEEQKRIVAKIEALQEEADAAKKALDAIPPLLEKFRRSVLASAFRGDLTKAWREQHPDVEPASKLLDRIREERRRHWEEAKPGKKYKVPEPVDPERDGLSDLPDGWCWASFEEVAEVASSLVAPSDHPDAPHIAPNHIESETGRLLAYTTIREDGVTSPKHRFYSGQILYSKIRPYLAKAVIVDFDGLCSADMYPVRTDILPTYLHRWLICPVFTHWATKSQGRTVLPKINQNALARLPVPLAPAEEQVEVARLIDLQLDVATSARTATEEAAVRWEQLNQSILAKAFRGELVPQDPNDEPASKLLERIQKGRPTDRRSSRRRDPVTAR